MKDILAKLLVIFVWAGQAIGEWRRRRREKKRRQREQEYRDRLSRHLGVVLVVCACLMGCGTSSTSGTDGIQVYYLYPGEPAPVEGPQIEDSDFRLILRRIEQRERGEDMR